MRKLAVLLLMVAAAISCDKDEHVPFPDNRVVLFEYVGDSCIIVYETKTETEERGLAVTHSYDRRFMGDFSQMQKYVGRKGVGLDTITVHMPIQAKYVRSYGINGDITHLSENYVKIQR